MEIKEDEVIKFLKFIKEYLNISKMPKIILQNNRKGLVTTASYIVNEDGNNIIRVWSKNRHLIDILRSLAHELVHHKQKESGSLILPIQDIGGEIENEANSLAGEIIKKYIYENKYLLESKKTKSTLLIETLSKIPYFDNPPKKGSVDKEILRAAIISELDAINLYEQLAKGTNNSVLRKIFLDIAKEEKTHVGELQSLLKKIDKEFTSELIKGDKEVKNKTKS